MSDRPFRPLLWVPLPPPYAGPEIVSTVLAEASRVLVPEIRVENATIRKSNMSKGRIDLTGIEHFLRALPRFVRGVHGADVVCLVVAANHVGALRDAMLIAVARALGTPSVIHLHGARYGEYFAESPAVMKWLLRRAWGSAARAIVLSPSLRGLLGEAVPHVPVDVVPNALPAERFARKQSYADSKRVLFVGHLTAAKGFYDLLQCFRLVRMRHPQATLVCAGEIPSAKQHAAAALPRGARHDHQPEPDVMMREIREAVDRGAAEGIEYHGIVDRERLAALYLGADLFVLPSYAEGVSMAMLEAMFHGLPVIVTNVGGHADVITPRRNGALVTAGRRSELVAALDEFLSSRSMRERCGRLNADEARSKFDSKQVAPQFVAALRRASHDHGEDSDPMGRPLRA